MQHRITLSPWAVAGLFAPTAFALWGAGMGVVQLDANGTRVAFQIVSLIQLFMAIALYESLLRRYGAEAARGGAQGVGLAIATLFIAELSHSAAAQRTLADTAFLPAAATLMQQLVLIALPEELWFRGLWMKACGGRPFLAILGGAAGFGLYHLHQGPEMMVTAAAIGVLFGAARWGGAPIWALACAHGVMNWLNTAIAPAPAWRFDATISRAIFICLILAGALLVYRMALRSQKNRIVV